MTILDELKKIVVRVTHCNEHDISPDTPLKDLHADSLHWVQIIVGIESTFDVEIDIERMKEFQCVDDFVKHIEDLLQ